MLALDNSQPCLDCSLSVNTYYLNEKKTQVYLLESHSSTMRSLLIPFVISSKCFIWSYLCIKELVMSPLNSVRGISVATERPYGSTLVNLDRRGVLRQYYGKDDGMMCHETGLLRYSYGYSRGNSSVGTDPNNFVTKPFNDHLKLLSSTVHALLLNNRKELNLEGVDLSVSFNHCTILLYFADKTLKPVSSMPFHCDVTYNHKGQYVDSANEQIENTPSVIISLGDTRYLKWRLQICLVNKATGRLKWYNVSKTNFIKTMALGDKTILIVNTLDERPFLDSGSRCFMRYQHGNVNVKDSAFTCGLVLRVVKGKSRYNIGNQLVDNSKDKKIINVDVETAEYHENFHEGLKQLFVEKFQKYELESINC